MTEKLRIAGGTPEMEPGLQTSHRCIPPREELVSADRFAAAPPFDAYVDLARKNVEFWRGIHRTFRVPDGAARRLGALPRGWRLLALSEDWCGDAMNILPQLARLVDDVPDFELRILPRDQNDDLMVQHLTAGTRSIPVVMLLDSDYREHAWWGPRPSSVQAWMRGDALALATEERSRRKREWYARDRGRTTMEEILRLFEEAAIAGVSPPPPSPV